MNMTDVRRKLFGIAAIAVGILAVVSLIGPAGAEGATSKDGTIKIEAAWARETPNGAKVAGGYLKITNTASKSDRLTSGTLVAAGRVEIHEMTMADGVMKMRQLDAGLEIKPAATVEFKPGGYHLMFMDMKAPIKEHESIAGTLVFQNAGTVDVYFHVTAMGATSPSGHQH